MSMFIKQKKLETATKMFKSRKFELPPANQCDWLSVDKPDITLEQYEGGSPKRILIPVHLDNPLHWTLLVIDFIRKKFFYCDSLFNEEDARNNEEIQNVINGSRKILKMAIPLYDEKRNDYLERWPVYYLQAVEQKGVECGIFMINYARSWAEDSAITENLKLVNGKQTVMGERIQIIKELLNGKIKKRANLIGDQAYS